MSIVRADLNAVLVETAKAIVKEQGFQWSYYIEQAMEKALTETVEKMNVEKQILRGGE